jgi:hypothetical protein
VVAVDAVKFRQLTADRLPVLGGPLLGGDLRDRLLEQQGAAGQAYGRNCLWNGDRMSPQKVEAPKLGGGLAAGVELGEDRDRLAVEDPAGVRRPVAEIGEAGRPPSRSEMTRDGGLHARCPTDAHPAIIAALG